MSSSGYPVPPIRPNPNKSPAGRPDYEQVIQKAIQEDPEIAREVNISVNVQKEEIHLIGKVGSGKNKARAQELAEINSQRKMKVVNELVVGRRALPSAPLPAAALPEGADAVASVRGSPATDISERRRAHARAPLPVWHASCLLLSRRYA